MIEIQEEVSAGGVLIRRHKGIKQALLIKVKYYGYELPKGHPEGDETLEEAAARELCEETSLLSKPIVGFSLGELDYTFSFNDKVIHKTVYYYVFTLNEKPRFAKKPPEVKELKWISKGELNKIPLVNEKLRPIIARAFSNSNEL